MKSDKLVSVVIPTYNREKTLKRAIDSVLNQTYENLECIIVDDASTDNTDELIKSINDDRLIYIRHSTNKFASAARNTGMEAANGTYIALQDSDDEWYPTKIEKQVKLIESLTEEYGLVYCWQDYYEDNNKIHEHHKSNRGMIFPDVLANIMTGGTQTLLFRKEVFEKVGGFDTRITNGDDQDFIRRICQQYKVDVVEEVLVKLYINHGSETRLSDPKVDKNNRDFISSLFLEIEKFEDALRSRKDLRAKIYTNIAYHYALLGDKKSFYKYTRKAIADHPWRGRIKSTLRGIKKLKEKKN